MKTNKESNNKKNTSKTLILTSLLTGALALSSISTVNNYVNNNDIAQIEAVSNKNATKDEQKITIKQVESNFDNTFAIVNDGTRDHLYGWGSNLSGQLQIEGSKTFNEIWTEDLGQDDWWNENSSDPDYDYQEHSKKMTNFYYTQAFLYLLNNKNLISLAPREIDFGPTTYDWEIKQISVARDAVGVVVNDGTRDHLYVWGNPYVKGNYGFDSSTIDWHYSGNSRDAIVTPKEVDFGEEAKDWEIKQFDFGDKRSAGAILHDNENDRDHLYMWGNNHARQLGFGGEKPIWGGAFKYDAPQKDKVNFEHNLPGASEFEIKQISLGWNYASAILHDKTNNRDHLMTWGLDNHGQLGNGEQQSMHPAQATYSSKYPEEVDFGTGTEDWEIKQVETGLRTTSAILNDGTNDYLYTWGSNEYGLLGKNDNNKNRIDNEPKFEVNNGTSTKDWEVKQVSLGSHNGTAIFHDPVENQDHLYIWGDDEWGLVSGNHVLGGNFNWDSNYYSSLVEVDFGEGTEDWEIKEVNVSYSALSLLFLTDRVPPVISVVLNDGENDHLYTWGSNASGQIGIGRRMWVDNWADSYLGQILTNVSEGKDWYDDVNFDFWFSKPVEISMNQFELTNDSIEFITTSEDSIQVSIDSPEKTLMMDEFKPETLKAKVQDGEDLEVNLIETRDQTYTFEISGLNPGTTYGAENGNAVQLSNNNWDSYVSLDTFETVGLFKPIDPTKPLENNYYWLLLLIILLIILLILILLIAYIKRIKIKKVIWLNKDEVLVLLNKKNKIEARAQRLEIFEKTKDGFIERIESEILSSANNNSEKEAKIVLRRLENRTYKKLQFEIQSNKNNKQLFKNWRRIHGKVEPFEKQTKRDLILSKAASVAAINLQEVYGVGPKIEKHFFDHGFDTAEKVIKLKVNHKDNEELIANLPSLKGVTYKQKEKKVKNIIEELKFLRKEINKNNN